MFGTQNPQEISCNSISYTEIEFAFSVLSLLVGRKSIRPVKTKEWGTRVVICLERDADLHTAQLMPLQLPVSCFSKIQIGFTFLVPAHPGSPGQRAVKQVRVSISYLDLRDKVHILNGTSIGFAVFVGP